MDKFLNIKSPTKLLSKKRPITYTSTTQPMIKSFFSAANPILAKSNIIPLKSTTILNKPFWWINSLSNIYSSLPLPVNQQNYSCKSLNRLRSNNWFCAPSTYNPTFNSLNNVSSIISQKVQEFLKPLEIPKKKVKKGRAKVKTEFKTHKIRLFPTKKQKEILNTWFKANRLVYNECVNYYCQHGAHEIYANMNFLSDRFCKGYFFNQNVIDACKKMWIFEPKKIPYAIKRSACDDFVKALDINIAKKPNLK